jgi:type I restriction enzyme S subunit
VAEQLEAVEKARSAARTQLDAAKALPAAYLRETFPKPMDNLPSGWRWAKVGEVCEFLYGVNLPAVDRDLNGQVPVYGSNGIVGKHSRSVTNGPTIIIGRKGSIGEIHISPVSCWPIDTTYYIESCRTQCNLYWLASYLTLLDLRSLNKAAAVPATVLNVN